jgi:hypothetical protein
VTLITDEILSAYLDAELDADGVAMVESELARTPSLARRLEAMKAIEARISPAFSGIMDERTPDRFEAMLSPNAPRAPSPGPWHAEILSRLLRPWVAGPAFAALAVGVLAGTSLTPRAATGFELAQTGRIVTAGALSSAIDLSPSGVATRVKNSDLLVRLSFQDRSGRFCRHVSLAAQDMVVCKTNGGWGIEAVAPGGTGPVPGYQEASGAAPLEIASAMERLGVVSVLDANSEGALISRNWK